MDSKGDFQQEPHTNYSAPYSGPPPQLPPPQQPPPYYQPVQQNYGATVVVGQPVPSTTFIAAPVNDNMGLAIFACLCCCWPIGLVAIFKANECREALDRGDLQTAVLRSSEARTFSLISIGLGVVLVLGSIIAIVVIFTSIY